MKPPSPAAAAWLSLVPGLGHIYVGLAAYGFAFGLVAVGVVDLVDRSDGSLGLLVPLYWFFVVLHAYRLAQASNQPVEKGESRLPSRVVGGTPWSGWVLVGLGILFLLLNFDLISVNWIWKLWPIALIVIGIRLIRPTTAGDQGPSTSDAAGRSAPNTKNSATPD